MVIFVANFTKRSRQHCTMTRPLRRRRRLLASHLSIARVPDLAQHMAQQWIRDNFRHLNGSAARGWLHAPHWWHA